MNGHPQMPVPGGELSPQQLASRIHRWADSQGYGYQLGPHTSEFGIVRVSDPANGHTTVVIPNSHRGRKVRKDQVRSVVQRLNANLKE